MPILHIAAFCVLTFLTDYEYDDCAVARSDGSPLMHRGNVSSTDPVSTMVMSRVIQSGKLALLQRSRLQGSPKNSYTADVAIDGEQR